MQPQKLAIVGILLFPSVKKVNACRVPVAHGALVLLMNPFMLMDDLLLSWTLHKERTHLCFRPSQAEPIDLCFGAQEPILVLRSLHSRIGVYIRGPLLMSCFCIQSKKAIGQRARSFRGKSTGGGVSVVGQILDLSAWVPSALRWGRTIRARRFYRMLKSARRFLQLSQILEVIRVLDTLKHLLAKDGLERK